MTKFFWGFLFLCSSVAHAEGETAKVVLAGDMMAPIRLKKIAVANGLAEESYFGSLLEQIRPVVKAADIAFVNLETPVSQTEAQIPRPFVFNAPQELLKGLKWTGFNILNLANNHALDQKAAGLAETIASVKKENLRPLGADANQESALKGQVIDVHGVRVGFLAFATVMNGGTGPALKSKSPYINLTERKKEMFAAIDSMKKRADVILFSIHWGVEYENTPRTWQLKLADELHERGVDVVIGHHPHVLQPAHYFIDRQGRQKLTLFSLGNLVSNQSRSYSPKHSPMAEGAPRDGALIELHLSAQGLESFLYYPLWVDNWNGPEEGIRTILIDRELRRLEAEIANRKRPSPEKSFLIGRRNMLMDRRRIIEQTLFPKSIAPLLLQTSR